MVYTWPASLYAMDALGSTGWHIHIGALRLLRYGEACHTRAMESYSAIKPANDYKDLSLQSRKRFISPRY